jgi:hypothetical protein
MLGVNGRFFLRVGVVAVIAGLAVLKTVIGDGLTAEEVVDVLATTLGAGAAYAGIGAISANVEPNVVSKAPPGTPGT